MTTTTKKKLSFVEPTRKSASPGKFNARKPEPANQARIVKTTQAALPSKPAAASSKQQRVLTMLGQPAGSTIAAIMKATDRQAHSVRGFLAGVVKKKLKLKLSSKIVADVRVYKIVNASGQR